jgi:hypothetical protein
MDMQIFGTYAMMGFVLEVEQAGGELTARIPGAPAGYEIRLEGLEAGRFRMRGGPVDGSTLAFMRGEGGKVTGLQIGVFEFEKVAPENEKNLAVIERLTAPRLAMTAEKEAAFKQLLDAILEHPDGRRISYELDWPKYEFVQYVMAKDVFIFHGSNNREIEAFAPVRGSVELFDRNGAGNLQAVYGTHDGLWSMFFAVVDRKRLNGSIRNGVMYLHNRAGEALAVYNFSINQDQLGERPWCDGALYLLPRESFERQKLTEDSYSNEWASYTTVKPAARLDVKPEDFPFLEKIGGHDDGLLIRSEELGRRVHDAALAASLEEARFSVTLPNNPEMAKTLAEWIEIQRKVVPSAQFTLEEGAAGLMIVINNLPPAYRQVYGDRYRELIVK